MTSKNKSLKIRNYSKVLFMYPLLIISIIGWILQATYHTPMPLLEIIWLVFFFITLFIVVFDFSASRFIILFLICIIFSFVGYFFILPKIATFLSSDITVSFGFTSHFYIVMTAITVFFIIIAILSPLFNYYVIERNEIYHRKGIFTMAERYSTSHLKFKKEIPDVFEFFLLGAGRLIIYVGNDIIYLPTVLRINNKEKRLNSLLSHIQVEPDEID